MSVTEKALARYVLDLERQRDYWKRQAAKYRKNSKADDYTDALLRAAELKVELNEARAEAEKEKAANKHSADCDREDRRHLNAMLLERDERIGMLSERLERARGTLLMFIEEMTPPGDEWQRQMVGRCKDGAAEVAP